VLTNKKTKRCGKLGNAILGRVPILALLTLGHFPRSDQSTLKETLLHARLKDLITKVNRPFQVFPSEKLSRLHNPSHNGNFTVLATSQVGIGVWSLDLGRQRPGGPGWIGGTVLLCRACYNA